jgi:hypothetical protein
VRCNFVVLWESKWYTVVTTSRLPAALAFIVVAIRFIGVLVSLIAVTGRRICTWSDLLLFNFTVSA